LPVGRRNASNERLAQSDRVGSEFGRPGSPFERHEPLRLAACLAEAREIRLHGAIRPKPGKHGGEDWGHARVEAADPVVHPLAFPPRTHDARFLEVGEMARDFGLALPEDFHEIAYADFATVHEVEKAQASGVGEGCKEQGQTGGCGNGSHGPNIRLDRYDRQSYICLDAYEEAVQWRRPSK
jgi:hypothetical protein